MTSGTEESVGTLDIQKRNLGRKAQYVIVTVKIISNTEYLSLISEIHE